MSDVSLSLQQQVSQAIAQLSKAGAEGQVTQKGVEVLIQRLTGNQLIFSDTRNQRQVQINKHELQGNLISGQTYQTAIEIKNTQTLMSFLPTNNATTEFTKLATLSQPQLNNVIKAVGEQLIAGAGSKPIILNANVLGTRGAYVSLQIKVAGQELKISIPAPKDGNPLQAGQQVQVQLTPVANQWQVKLLASANHPVSGLPGPNQPTSNLHNPLSTSSRVEGKELINLLQSGLNQSSQKGLQLPLFEIPKSAIGRLSVALPSIVTPSLKQALLADNGAKLLLQPDTKGHYQLRSQEQKPLATIKLDGKSLEQIKAVLPELLKQPNDKSPNASQATATNPPAPVTSTSNGPISVENAKIEQARLVHKELITILRKVLPAVQSPSEALQQLDKALNPAQIRDTQLKPQLEQMLNQIKQAIPQGKSADAEAIKQILTTAPLNLTPASLTSTTHQQGLMGGLVALLQVALASRMARSQNHLSERLSQFVSQLVATKALGPNPATAKTNMDVSQLDQRGQALKEIGRIFSSHQANKLANAEQALQGQDSFYYTLPSAFGNTARDIELLIRREPEKQAENEKKSPKNSTWHLTMKLSLGDVGEMLTKARLTKDYLEIDFYTSNNKVKELILEYLPLLKKRFTQLGIELGKTGCQLGKIPSTLQNKPYGIFEAKA